MYEDFLKNFCKNYGIDEESDLELAIVREIIEEKERIGEEEQIPSEEK